MGGCGTPPGSFTSDVGAPCIHMYNPHAPVHVYVHVVRVWPLRFTSLLHATIPDSMPMSMPMPIPMPMPMPVPMSHAPWACPVAKSPDHVLLKHVYKDGRHTIASQSPTSSTHHSLITHHDHHRVVCALRIIIITVWPSASCVFEK